MRLNYLKHLRILFLGLAVFVPSSGLSYNCFTDSVAAFVYGIPVAEGTARAREIRRNLRKVDLEKETGRTAPKFKKRNRRISNVALADAHIDGERISLQSASGRRNFPEMVEVPSERVFETGHLKGYSREWDAEVKILERLARRLTPESVGHVRLFSLKPLCPSCQGVVQQFRTRFPNVRLLVTHGD